MDTYPDGQTNIHTDRPIFIQTDQHQDRWKERPLDTYTDTQIPIKKHKSRHPNICTGRHQDQCRDILSSTLPDIKISRHYVTHLDIIPRKFAIYGGGKPRGEKP